MTSEQVSDDALMIWKSRDDSTLWRWLSLMLVQENEANTAQDELLVTKEERVVWTERRIERDEREREA